MDDIHTIYIGLSGLVPTIYLPTIRQIQNNSEHALDWQNGGN